MWSCLPHRGTRDLSSDKHAAPLPLLSTSLAHHTGSLTAGGWGGSVTNHSSFHLVFFFQVTRDNVKPNEANRTIPLLATGFSPLPELLGPTKGLGGDRAALHSTPPQC